MRRTVAFVDLCGFTRMTGVHGDDGAADQLTGFRVRVRTACASRAVTVVRWLGDGVLLAADEPTAMLGVLDELDAAPGPGALAVRAGVATGPVVPFDDDDIAGATVNRAARLCEVAVAHQVLVDRDTADRLADLRRGVELGGRVLKGFDSDVEVVDLTRCDHERRRRDPICGMELPEDRWNITRQDPAAGLVVLCSPTCAARWDAERAEPETPQLAE